ncbi:DNA replication licensing factor Mcm3 [Leptopilina heterotoma]|uniref:DNA replication licensing factor Mcm3 n=1 Tax=Leptopilina heterotoma TaxID=63436 RepID=UPI001CA85F76|nr:DNA replication licensing factor Mcm3 [Leptopilina heterotoma]XP_043463142.1 DNA replication licensing factor Mcm3 [Leptopilina heterotoma]
MDQHESDQQIKILEREYLEFLDDVEYSEKYTNLVKNMIEENKRRLYVNINDLRKRNPKRAASLLENSFEEQMAFENALKQFTSSIDPDFAKSNKDVFVGFEGSFGSRHVTPRTLTSRFLGNLVCLEGIVTKCSLVRPKIVRSVHFCEATKAITDRAYSDLTSYDAYPASAVYPTTDEDGNALETQYGLSTYKDHQTLSIQEMPERAPAGQLPRSVDIVCDNDLVDVCKPGDRVQIVGNYRCLPGKQGGYTTGTFRTILIANSISLLSKEQNLTISSEDLTRCKEMSKNKKINMFQLLSKSMAPSIYGHDFIKKAILCLMLGGTEKNLPNGTRLRGDINVLLIGDPSVAKSQLLRYVLCTAPRAIPTTGRGSSGVGLTAAVTSDQETGERRLEAGAMVLADRGVICIDEFDKMSDIDRTAIHEVMEQGKVTIAKAGIHASLNARCSVLAAANPVYGRYDQYKTPMENIGLQDSLLSRFDLLFVMLDIVDTDQDNVISDHVVRMHRYRNPSQQDGEALPFTSSLDVLSTQNPDAPEIEERETSIYEKYDPLLHGSLRSRKDKILTMTFMRKYIHIARCIKPRLTEEASKVIADEYAKLRSEDLMESDVARTQPITARTLETLIRLSTAHARARLSNTVEERDANAAIQLVQFAYFKRILEKEKKKRRRQENEESSGDEGVDDDDNNEDSTRRPKRTRKNPGEPGYDPYDIDNDVESQAEESQRVTRAETTKDQVSPTEASSAEPTTMEIDEPVEINVERLQVFKTLLNRLFTEQHAQALPVDTIREFVNSKQSIEFTQGEFKAAIDKMTNENQIMEADGQVFLI